MRLFTLGSIVNFRTILVLSDILALINVRIKVGIWNSILGLEQAH